MRLVICAKSREAEAPELAGHWFKTNGRQGPENTQHVPTPGHATALKGLGLLKEDWPIEVSPNLLKELGAKAG